MNAVLSLLVAGFVLLLSGCGASHAEPAASESPAAAVYKAGSGVQLSPGAREIVQLKTIDIAPREIGAAGRQTAIPASALLRTVKGDFVYVANGPWFMRTAVTVSASDGSWFHVTDGLYEGDTVVSHGANVLWLAELQAVNGGTGCADGI